MGERNNPFSDSSKSKLSSEMPKAYNILLYDHLQQGNTINFVQARAMGISQLDMQIAEIRKVTSVYSRIIRINALSYKEYSLHPFIT